MKYDTEAQLIWEAAQKKRSPVEEGKPHNCATHVEHSKWGKGECISESHAEPDENGNVAWYNVVFEHGTEKVNTADVKVLKSSHHMHASHNPIKISKNRGEYALRMRADGWQRCPHNCIPDAGDPPTYRHQDGSPCPECEGKGYVTPDHIKSTDRPGRDYVPPTKGDYDRGVGMYASTKSDPSKLTEASPDDNFAASQAEISAIYKEIDEYMTRAGAEGLKDNVLAIVKQYLEGPIISYYEDDTTTDTHNQYMIAQDKWNNALAALKPLDKLAARYGGEDINPAGGNIKGGNIIDWLAKQIEDQGQNWVDWFEQQVMTEE
jgi:hypothetical protein